MKFVNYLIIFAFIYGCSFDNKTGIWKNENVVKNEIKSNEAEFVNLNEIFSKSYFNKTISLDKDFIFNISAPINKNNWHDYYYSYTNNLDNFSYSKLDNEIYKSKKLSGKRNNIFSLFHGDTYIFSDRKGNIIFFSLSEKKITNKFNFYKKKYKKNFEKKLNLLIENNNLYISDNLGFIYAYDLKLKKISWAKNYKVPFRSNLKIKNNKIFTSNQNNDFLVISSKSGEIIKKIPTEENNIQNTFINNIANNNLNTLFFLNSYGSLYSIDAISLQVNWFINLNRSFDLNPLNNFLSQPIIYHKKKIIVSTDTFTYIINSETGTTISKLNFSSITRPLINNNYLFLINRNNFLIAFDLTNNKILYSYSIDEQIADTLKIKKQKVSLKNFMLVNNDFLFFLNNSYILYFNIKGKLKEIKKLNSKISSEPIFVNSTLLYLDKKNRLRLLN